MRALLLGLLAMSIAQATPMTEIEITYEPDAWAAGKADTIAAQVPTGVPRAELLNHRNGAPFLHLAARNADARVVAAALLGMARTWSRTGKGDRPKVDADFRKVVLARLGDANGKVVAAALGAVRLLTGGIKPDAVALDRVLKLAVKGTAPGRAAAIDALVNVRAFQLPRAVPGDVKGRVVAAILPALDAKAPFLVATAAHRLARSAYVQMPHRDKLAAAAKRLEGHADPGVRAMALLIAARVAKATEKAEIASRLRKGIADKSAVVRAAALDAAVALGDPTLAHDAITRLDDAGQADHSVRGFTALDGSPGQVRIRIADARVDSAALRALQALSGGKFTYKRPAGPQRDARRAEAIKAARAWYETAKTTLPRAPVAAK